MIPKQISFFWTGRMSWLRWLTLQSFCKFNPSWEVYLYHPVGYPIIPKEWTSEANDDSAYKGKDYSQDLPIGVQCLEWEMPRPLPAAQASDVFQWWLLSTKGGFYSDMDILWLAPLDNLYARVKESDVALCFEDKLLAIGFMAGTEDNRLFTAIYNSINYNRRDIKTNYQELGVTLLLRLAKIRMRHMQSGIQVMNKFNAEYQVAIYEVPSRMIYPFDWRQISKIFSESNTLPKDTLGIHWFGGAPLSRSWSHLLTPDNWKTFPPTTILNCLGEVV